MVIEKITAFSLKLFSKNSDLAIIVETNSAFLQMAISSADNVPAARSEMTDKLCGVSGFVIVSWFWVTVYGKL